MPGRLVLGFKPYPTRQSPGPSSYVLLSGRSIQIVTKIVP